MTLAMTLENAPLGDALPSLIDRLGVKMSFAKDEEIFGQDDEADLVYRVVLGVVRTSRLLNDGRRQIGGFYYAGQLFGLDPGPLRHYAAEGLTDCRVQALKRSALRDHAAERELDQAIWQATCRELERAQDHVLLLGRKTAEERVASFLMDLAQRRPAGAVDLPMGRRDMADYLGLTIETISRVLTRLQGSEVVAFDNSRQFRVRRWDALERLAA